MKLPDGWSQKTVSDLVEFRNGKAHENIIDDAGKFIVINSKFISSDGKEFKRCKENLAPLFVNDIVMVMSDIPNGKALAKCFLVKDADKYTLNQRICSLRSLDEVSAEYLFYYLNRNKYFLSFDSGVGQTNLRKDEILDCPVLLPPLPEQKRIALILSVWDRAIETIDKLIDVKTQLKKGLMQKLLTGKVRFKEFKREQWRHVKISELCEIHYGKSQKGLPSGKYKIYGTGGVVGTTNTYLYDKPSVIIGRKGTIDAPVYIDEPFYPIDTVFYVSFKEEILPKWFYYQLRMIDLKRYNETSGVPSLNRETLCKIKINTASLKEQNKTSSFFSVADRELEFLFHMFEAIKKQKQGLMQKLLTGKIRVKV